MSRAVSPNLSHAKLAVERLIGIDRDPVIFGAVMMLYVQSAANRVWTYSEPSDGWIEIKDIHKIVGLSRRQWAKIEPLVAWHFISDGARWFPKRDAVEITVGSNRPAVPAHIRAAIMFRDKFRCQYCGTEDGPFDLDHIIPLAQGGDPVAQENLICACFRCNRQKGAFTPEQWSAQG